MKKIVNKVSVVVPVYNASSYIERCVDSILNQTFRDFELLLINDGSTDNSLEVIEKYKKYKNVRIINQENHGVACTRNFGIEEANGKYIMFIDNDDFIANDYIMNYYNAITKEDLDAVFGGYERVDINNKVLNRVILDDTEWSKYMIVSPWAKIFKLSFIRDNKILFLDSNIGEDIYFNVQLVNLSNKIKIIDDVGYKWFYNELSISNTLHKNVSKELQFEFLINSVYEKLNKINKLNEDYVEYFFIKTICWYIFYINSGNKLDVVVKEFKYYMEWLKNKFSNYNKNKYLSILKPKGESFKTRVGVYLLIKSYKFKFYKILLSFFKG